MAQALAIHNMGQARTPYQTLSGGRSAHVSSQMILEAVQGAFVGISEREKGSP
ncbi:MAG TPA: hypothetical protein VFB14_29060 [Bryobacteraceae bacterium]|jgi:hypothetical protein|nr:hypothetical protein [Bryobacteraceae bacterium]